MTSLNATQPGQQIHLASELKAPSKPRWLWPLLLTIVYVAVVLPFVWRHEIWRDEAQAFLLARDSASPWQLVMNARYEGHPLLWHMLLWCLTRIWLNPLGMQLLHLAMAAGSVYLFARYAPVPFLTKILFAFSYYSFFEYAIIARNYQPMLLLTLAFCVLWQRRRSSFLWQSLVLGLLAHTNIFGTLISLALFSLMFWEMNATRIGWGAWRAHYVRSGLAILLFGALAAAAIMTMKPPADSGFATTWTWNLTPHHIQETQRAVWGGLMPVPPDTENFWNRNILDGHNAKNVTTYLYWLVGITAGLLLFSPRGLYVYLIGSSAIVAFIYVKYIGSVRHQGSLYVVLLCAAWIALAPRPKPPRYFGQLARGLLQVALIGFLAVHVWASVIVYKNISHMKLTNGRQAAECLKQNMRPDEPLIADLDATTASIAAYLPGHQFYFPRGDRWGTYTIWDQARHKKSAFQIARAMAEEKKQSVIVILFGGNSRGPRDAEKLGAFGGSSIGDDYTIFRINPRPVATAPATRPVVAAATRPAASAPATTPATSPAASQPANKGS